MKVYLIIPAYNEQSRIIGTLEFYEDVFKKYVIKHSIIVVSESTDKTNAIVRNIKKRHDDILLIYSKRRLGKGGAIMKGFLYAMSKSSGNDLIGFVDADNAVYASEFMRMVRYLEANKGVKGVIASRYLKGSKIVGHLPLPRHLSSRLYNLMVRLLFGLRYNDTQCGAKVFRHDAIKKIIPTLSVVDMSFDINLLYSAKRLGMQVKELPITYHQMNEGTKLILHKQIPQMFIATLGFRISRSRFNRLFPSRLKGYVYETVRKW
ncbi:MAG: glycosyltransferase [Candidatus Micrarchaeaceae archaeon]